MFIYLHSCKNKLNLWKAYPSSDGIYVCAVWNLAVWNLAV